MRIRSILIPVKYHSLIVSFNMVDYLRVYKLLFCIWNISQLSIVFTQKPIVPSHRYTRIILNFTYGAPMYDQTNCKFFMTITQRTTSLHPLVNFPLSQCAFLVIQANQNTYLIVPKWRSIQIKTIKKIKFSVTSTLMNKWKERSLFKIFVRRCC